MYRWRERTAVIRYKSIVVRLQAFGGLFFPNYFSVFLRVRNKSKQSVISIKSERPHAVVHNNRQIRFARRGGLKGAGATANLIGVHGTVSASVGRKLFSGGRTTWNSVSSAIMYPCPPSVILALHRKHAAMTSVTFVYPSFETTKRDETRVMGHLGLLVVCYRR